MRDKEQLLEGLNKEQLEAVLHRGSDSLILAGAGAGKTRVLTTKIAYLLTQGVAPFQILALTFTNKAAQEMRGRVGQLVGNNLARYITMGTFHSVFARWLRLYADRLGYTDRYTIYDTTDSRALVKMIIKDFELSDKMYKPNSVQSLISGWKNDGLSPQDVTGELEGDLFYIKKNMPDVARVYREYEDRCMRANAMDFDDLLLNMYRLLKRDEEVREQLQERFKFILVDEYQDTNRVQHMIIQLLKAPDAEVTVVGDDAQSIYSFRGAVIDNIINFQRNFEGAKLFKLIKNYRSTGNIVGLANGLIAKNEKRIPKTVEAVAGEGEKIVLFQSFSASMEAQMVAAQIYKLIDDGVDPEEIAILYRTNAQSRLFEQHLNMFMVPFRIYGGLSFFDRKEVKDVLAYLRLLINPNDDEAFRRIYNTPTRGIGATSFEGLASAANESQLPLMSVARDPIKLHGFVRGAGINSIGKFVELIDVLTEKAEEQKPEELLKEVIKLSGLREMYNDGSVEGQARLENISELLSTLQDYIDRKKIETGEEPTLEDFVREMALYTDRDQTDDDTPKVTLMTMHASKGLEYGYIYCVGLEEGLIPSDRSQSREAIEEERRLFYVAITRAKKQCTLSFARERMLNGQINMCSPSRFLLDLEPDYIDDVAGHLSGKPSRGKSEERSWKSSARSSGSETKRRVTRVIRKKQIGSEGISKVEAPSLSSNIAGTDLEQGDLVFHEHFGKGEIIGFSESVSGAKATIRFEEGGEKQLILKFAKLRKL